jgi:hypothetical protein
MLKRLILGVLSLLLLSPLSAQAQVQATSEHVIAVRTVDGAAEFYHTATGDSFVPRGMNYIRLADQTAVDGSHIRYQSAWNPGRYDSERTREAFAAMHADGYNVVRVFISTCCAEAIGDPAGGLTPEYLDNMVDMLRLAEEYELYVMLTTDDVPKTGGYTIAAHRECCERFAGYNVHYLSAAGLDANIEFWTDFVSGLIERDAPLNAIWAYSLRNEAFFAGNQPPLNWDSGSITTANGETYDMSDPAQKRQMMDDSMIYFIDNLRAAILELDPMALVTIGFFWPQDPNPIRIGDWRIINTDRIINESEADFIDLHAYPSEGLSFVEAMENFGVTGQENVPLVMGELGARRDAYHDADAAARSLVNWQVESCAYGFDGWLVWTWDANRQADFYNALFDEGQIDAALAPANRPNPCLLPVDFKVSLTENATATASGQQPGFPPANAIDGDSSTWWSAGAGPVQWIQIDLGTPSTIAEISLQTSQSPPGETTHRVVGIYPNGTRITLATISDYTEDMQWLMITPEQPVENIRYIAIETTISPSWVAWREIEVR